MASSYLWIVSRNASSRPTLSHAVNTPHDALTLCGVFVANWSRHYLTSPLPHVGCKKCLKLTGLASLPVAPPASGSVIQLVPRTGT
jgi:hypothetical protein